MCSLLHKGQRPGVLRRVRFLKKKPHCRQVAGSIVKPLWCADFSICIRWSRTSFSLIPNNFEISRKSRKSPSNASAIFFLKVSILSVFKLTSEFYRTLLIDWPKDSRARRLNDICPLNPLSSKWGRSDKNLLRNGLNIQKRMYHGKEIRPRGRSKWMTPNLNFSRLTP